MWLPHTFQIILSPWEQDQQHQPCWSINFLYGHYKLGYFFQEVPIMRHRTLMNFISNFAIFTSTPSCWYLKYLSTKVTFHPGKPSPAMLSSAIIQFLMNFEKIKIQFKPSKPRHHLSLQNQMALKCSLINCSMTAWASTGYCVKLFTQVYHFSQTLLCKLNLPHINIQIVASLSQYANAFLAHILPLPKKTTFDKLLMPSIPVCWYLCLIYW